VIHATAALAAETVVVRDRPLRVERRAGTAEKPILRLEGCTSRDDAVALRGAELLVPAAPLEEDEYWASDLVGCTVVDGEHVIGEVARMIALPSCEALEVGSILIPMVRDAIRSIDIGAGRIDVDMAFVGG
jgi:16S rRNA processing protein RimM